MSPLLRTTVVSLLAVYLTWSIVNELRAGSLKSRGMVIDAKENPGGFYAIQFCKACFVSFAFAALLHALGLIGDPYIWTRQTFSSLAPR
ncbi:hypothetical protein [Bradyrhizobium sp. OAE829]|uniref:hypothetical protein n=1 Tax=Bradyrhizobium sp. OAE829 TaxID=2663807 RepID=UPI00178B1AE1